jgi:hypothetical protein
MIGVRPLRYLGLVVRPASREAVGNMAVDGWVDGNIVGDIEFLDPLNNVA